MKQSRKSLPVFIGICILLLLVILLENLCDLIPGLPQVFQPTSPLFTVLKKAAVYSLVAVSMNLLNGFTGLFSLGQAGFMLLGAYTYAILMVPAAQKEQVYYLFEGCAFDFSLLDMPLVPPQNTLDSTMSVNTMAKAFLPVPPVTVSSTVKKRWP